MSFLCFWKHKIVKLVRVEGKNFLHLLFSSTPKRNTRENNGYNKAKRRNLYESALWLYSCELERAK